ncbi:MAG TPA: DnaJ domain-containing protein [Myxococcales bacterium]|nr:DnaJ domain-containing protein [Myxococcales bacterium]
MRRRDPYAVLGVAHDATPEEIKAVYRQLARTFHPDVSSDPGAEERFKAITEAFLLLHDPRRRAQWDAGRRQRVHARRPPRRRSALVEETEMQIGLRLAGIDLGGLVGVSVLVRRRALFEDPEPARPFPPLALPPGGSRE